LHFVSSLGNQKLFLFLSSPQSFVGPILTITQSICLWSILDFCRTSEAVMDYTTVSNFELVKMIQQSMMDLEPINLPESETLSRELIYGI
jgi:hypothetical protein